MNGSRIVFNFQSVCYQSGEFLGYCFCMKFQQIFYNLFGLFCLFFGLIFATRVKNEEDMRGNNFCTHQHNIHAVSNIILIKTQREEINGELR